MTLLDASRCPSASCSAFCRAATVTLRAFIDHATPRLREDLAAIARRIG